MSLHKSTFYTTASLQGIQLHVLHVGICIYPPPVFKRPCREHLKAFSDVNENNTCKLGFSLRFCPAFGGVENDDGGLFHFVIF